MDTQVFLTLTLLVVAYICITDSNVLDFIVIKFKTFYVETQLQLMKFKLWVQLKMYRKKI
jgi:hypothetical protein